MSPPSPPADLSETLASAAHDAWRRRMITNGWSPGPDFDEQLRTHDALVPFDQLKPDDRQITVDAVGAEGAESWLADLVDYPRGPDRPLTATEIRIGFPVIEVKKDVAGGMPVDGLHGEVVGWSTHPSGALKYVRVRWADGMVAEYSPFGGELRRA